MIKFALFMFRFLAIICAALLLVCALADLHRSLLAQTYQVASQDFVTGSVFLILACIIALVAWIAD